MAKNKTTETIGSVEDFVNALPDETKRADSQQLIDIFREQTGYEPKLWGASIIGFGSYHYKYDSGHEGDAPLAAFSPRKDAISLYLAAGFHQREALLERLGKHKSGKACIYIKRLADIDTAVLNQLIVQGSRYLQELYPNH